MENLLLLLVAAGSSSLCACTAEPQAHAVSARPTIVVQAPRGEPGDFRVCPDGRLITYARTPAGEQTVYYEEATQFEVDAQAACEFVTCTYDTAFMLKTQSHDAMESARFWLNEGFVRLPVGMAQRYQEMAKRGQYFSRLAQRLNLTPVELDAYLIENSVSDAEHAAMLAPVPPQLDLFAAAA